MMASLIFTDISLDLILRVTCNVDTYYAVPLFCHLSGEEDLGCNSDHLAGHDGAGRL